MVLAVTRVRLQHRWLQAVVLWEPAVIHLDAAIAVLAHLAMADAPPEL